ncbi:MAG: bifunctional 3-(3-hydroxy-phenyl)propionate/3-hydroxycinnamic acid hydroxylase [Gordonia paraffinivorans]
MSTQAPVLIVGAGPTGLTAAALLADLGVPSVILERWDDVYPQPRAVHLDDEVYRILARLGLADEFAAISRPGHGLRLVTRDLRVLAEFGRSPDGGVHGHPAASMFDQPDLERLLRTAVARRADLITLRGGIEVQSIDQTRTGVTVVASDRDTGAPLRFDGSYLLGCDGAGSLARSTIGGTWRDLGFSQRWLVVDIETAADLDQWDGVHQVCDTERAATYMRIGDKRYRWEFQLLDHESADDHASVDAVLPLIRPWLPAGTESTLTLIRSAEYTFRARCAQTWRDRRVFLLGDAAHLTPPFIGQGMGAGIRDAANLSWKLAAVLRGGVPESSLDSYQRERIPHALSMIRLAVTVGVAMTRGGSGGDLLRRIIAPRIARIPGLSARVTDSATPPLTASYYVRHGVVADHLPQAVLGVMRGAAGLPGTLAPNAVVDSEARRLDDHLDRFLLVTVDEPSPDQRFEIVRRGGGVLTVGRDEPLGKWLSGHRVRAALVRPDGTVMAAGADVDAVYTVVPTITR